jgi:hypothetical protein
LVIGVLMRGSTVLVKGSVSLPKTCGKDLIR